MPPILVTAAILVRDGRVLMAQQPAGKRLGLFWEFPGGRVEENETPEEALRRELREKLGIEICKVYPFTFVFFHYKGKDILLLGYGCELASGEPKTEVYKDIRWFKPGELGTVMVAPADLLIVERVEAAFF